MSKEKLSRIVGLRLLAIKEGAECGSIREVVMDVEKKSVEYLVLDTGKGCFGFCVLPNNKIAGMGKDFAITNSIEFVTDIWKEQAAMELAYTDSDLIGARVVSSNGDVVGKIVDFEFQLIEGVIERYIMEDGGILPAECIVTLSRGIVFIDQEKLEQTAPELMVQQSAPAAAPVEQAPAAPVVQAAPEAAPVEAAPVEAAPAEAAPEVAEAEEAPLASRLAALRNRSGGAAAPEANADMKNYFEKRRTEFLIGKVVKQRIAAADGSVLAEAGDEVTAEMVEKIKEADKIIELTMGVN